MNLKKVFSVLMMVVVMFTVAFATSCDSNRNVIVIGVEGPLTGGAAKYGQAVANSAQLAVDEINAKGGVSGYQLKLVSVDDANDTSKVSTCYATLLQKGVQVTLGCVTTKPCLEFSSLSKEDDLFFITPSATNDNVPQYANGFQMCFADTKQGTFSAQYVNDNVAAGTKIGVLYLSGDDYSQGIYQNFMAEIDSTKFTDVKVATFTEPEPTSLSEQVNQLKECDFIFLPIYYTPAATFLTQAKGIVSDTAIYFGCDGLDGIDTVEGFDINTIPQEVSYLSHFNASSAQAAGYVKAYTEKYGVDTLNQFGASAYDCVYVIAGAIEAVNAKEADAINPGTSAKTVCEKLKAVMNGGYKYSGVTGTDVTWDNNGYVNKKAGKYIVKEATK